MQSVFLFSPVHDPEILLALEPEELAGVVLQYLNSLSEGDQGKLNRCTFGLPRTVQQYPPEY